MKAVGLITEYNPFHNGHLHHLKESLSQTGAEVSVAVMSGHFLQRGEAALIDKWQRAKMALAAGVDVVVELPLPWACSSAPAFAEGGVKALNALNGVSSLCFGSEAGEIASLKRFAELLCYKQNDIERRTAELLKSGLTYPRAREKFLSELIPPGHSLESLNAPNNILGIEYLKALKNTSSPIEPATIQRIGAGFHDSTTCEGQIASATGIRRRLDDGLDVTGFMPPEAEAILKEALNAGETAAKERFLNLLLAQVFTHQESLKRYWLVENGIENRIQHVADGAETLEQLIGDIKTRQLTRTRIQRMLTSILLGLERLDTAEQLATGPRYLHLLAVSQAGEKFLAANRKDRSLPLVQNFSRIYSTLKRFYGTDTSAYRQALNQLTLELRATRVYTLLMSGGFRGDRSRDFYQPLIRQGTFQSGEG